MSINAMGFSLRINPSTCFTQNPPKPSSKPRFLTIRCSLPLSSDGAATGLAERPWKVADARLVLEDGSIWRAKSFGSSGTQVEQSRTDEELLKMSRSWDIVGVDLIRGVTYDAPYGWVDQTKSEWDFNSGGSDQETYRVVAYDFGIKHNILLRLASYGCKITVVPSTWPAAETLKMKPDGVLFSNGPGDPSAVPYAVETVKEILGKVPVFGNCMGHQLLGQALGGKTFKMKFDHHVGNHPVRNLRNDRVEINAQNHNYAIDPASLPDGVEVTHVNLNDGSCANVSSIPSRSISGTSRFRLR
ncbi:Carbamoyl-phosphate synthase small chain [Hibiscus syriacus]|uniref:carbamoyl-phosphate synthase (glutamine-hydrolyzing) n=1 Tax=Hibiscus syriacus TaxID=106335 RepID=A0A6A3BVK5_HIBSY|nr:Carbamoyl-phosphate synthase small chain [Hibiscus syriacus]